MTNQVDCLVQIISKSFCEGGFAHRPREDMYLTGLFLDFVREERNLLFAPYEVAGLRRFGKANSGNPWRSELAVTEFL